ncbi:hypothetical protein K501DRAFT_233149 [Backusella circina FSU 941]|nr:hypothetical protein K501DRAFT_233149 [Backusella circina FSU 941]
MKKVVKKNVNLKDFLHDIRVRNETKRTIDGDNKRKRSLESIYSAQRKMAKVVDTIQHADNEESNDQQIPESSHNKNNNDLQVASSSSSTKRNTKSKLDYTTEKVYAKDIPCPKAYKDQLNKLVPDYLSPLGSNDLFAYAPENLKAENLMCYVGQDHTGTPIHRDICGTMGHNIMLYGDQGAYSEWIIIEHKYRQKLSELLHPSVPEMRKTHVTTKKSGIKSSFLESDRAWLTRYLIKKAGLKCHIVTQHPGDFVIIPSRAYHQVRNNGVSVKIAWNRTTSVSLQQSFDEQLPLYNMINRPEVYKCKAIVYSTLCTWYKIIKENNRDLSVIPMYRQDSTYFLETVKQLLDLLLKHVIYPDFIESILDEEVNDQNITPDKDTPFEIICDFCHADVFSKYYHCKACDEYDLCTNCYARGRSCRHPLTMKMVQNAAVPIEYCIELYNNVIDIINESHNVLENKWDTYLTSQGDKGIYSLATVCRRIENYRSVKGIKSNRMNCSNCSKNFTIEKLSKQGYQLEDIFSQRREGNDQEKTIPYICIKCMQAYPERHKLTPDLSFNEIDLVYYLLPSHDERNWGSALDYGVNKSCIFPNGII